LVDFLVRAVPVDVRPVIVSRAVVVVAGLETILIDDLLLPTDITLVVSLVLLILLIIGQ